MNGLYPIIRRKRRPLIDSDASPAVVGNVVPVQSVAVSPVVESATREAMLRAPEPVAAVEPEAPKFEKQKVSDAKVSFNRNSR